MEVVGIPKAWTPGTMVPDYHGTHLTASIPPEQTGEKKRARAQCVTHSADDLRLLGHSDAPTRASFAISL